MDEKIYIKKLFKRNTEIEMVNNTYKDFTFYVKEGENELFEIIRDCLLENVNGSCMYSKDEGEVCFTVSKSDIEVIKVITKKIKKNRKIVLNKVIVNPYKLSEHLYKKSK